MQPANVHLQVNHFWRPARNPRAHRKGISRELSPTPFGNQVVRIHDSQYQFDRRLGNGWFGEVYAGRRLSDGQPVAIKISSLALHDFWKVDQNREAFEREIVMGRRLSENSNKIVRIYDFDFHKDGLCYIAMELGLQDLNKRLATQRFSPYERKLAWQQMVNIALTLHNEGIVHLDIKPDNLIMFHDGTIKLADLGIARHARQQMIGGTGSPPYTAPEVTTLPANAIAITTRKSDIWSWGAVLYHMTYDTSPDINYIPPCDRPPINRYRSNDPYLVDILKKTLRLNPSERLDAIQLAQHPYTRTA